MVLFYTSFLLHTLACARILGRPVPSLTQQPDQMQFVPFILLNVLDPIKIYFFKGATTETFLHMQENSFLLVGHIGDIDDNDYSQQLIWWWDTLSRYTDDEDDSGADSMTETSHTSHSQVRFYQLKEIIQSLYHEYHYDQ